MITEVAKAEGLKARAKEWEQLKDSGFTQAAYRKKKKKSPTKDKSTGQSFNFGTSMRAVKTASTQIQKLKSPEIEGIKPNEREELRAQLETLRGELEQDLLSLS